MTSSAILFTTLTILVTANARFIAPPLVHPILPVPMIGPMHPPLVTPFVRPIVPLAPAIFPVSRPKSVVTSGYKTRPLSTPFVMDEPRGFKREDPVIVRIVERPDPIREVYVIEQDRQPVVVERPRYEDSNNGDISIDGNVYISDPYAVNDLQRGSSVEQVVSRSVASGQLSRGNDLAARDIMDYPMPQQQYRFNLQNSPIVDPLMSSRLIV